MVANSERVGQATIGCFDPSQVRAWRDVQACDATGFLGLSAPNLSSMLQRHHWSIITGPSAHSSKSDSSGITASASKPSQPASDFALLEVPNCGDIEELRNHYLHPYLGKIEVSSVPDFYPDIGPQGTVHLVFRSGTADGSLSPSSSRFSLHGVEFHTRKVRLPAPLGTFLSPLHGRQVSLQTNIYRKPRVAQGLGWSTGTNSLVWSLRPIQMSRTPT